VDAYKNIIAQKNEYMEEKNYEIEILKKEKKEYKNLIKKLKIEMKEKN